MGSTGDSARVRPVVWVNCAASLDGRIAFAGGRRAGLSGPEDLQRVQRLRAGADAILVGVGTVVKDDPSLRVHWELLGERPGPNPTRVVVDASGRTPLSARVLDGSTPTIVATSERSKRTFPPHVRVLVAGSSRVELGRLFPMLYDDGVRTLMVEGGAEILSSVLRAGLFDRLTVYYAPVVIGGLTAPPVASGPETRGPEELATLELLGVERLGAGHLATYAPAGRKGALPRSWSRTVPGRTQVHNPGANV